MATVVVDTDVVSFAFKRDTRAAAYRQHLVGNTTVISFMTMAELDRWAISRNWGLSRRTQLAQLLGRFAVCYANRELCRIWAEVSEQARGNGFPIPCADAWTAAVAVLLDSPLVTHNPHDYRGIAGLTIVSDAAR